MRVPRPVNLTADNPAWDAQPQFLPTATSHGSPRSVRASSPTASMSW